MITILHYGLGNLGSIRNAFHRIGEDVLVTKKPTDILNAEKLLLPGVGSFDVGMSNLKQTDLIKPLEKAVIENNIPVLGICLGMHLFTNSSEEGMLPGLGWIDAGTIKFVSANLPPLHRVPHIGWNNIRIHGQTQGLLEGITEHDRFYFSHSYHLTGDLDELCIGSTTYGYSFPSVVHQDNIYGIQCHPERSHHSGLKILKNFARI